MFNKIKKILYYYTIINYKDSLRTFDIANNGATIMATWTTTNTIHKHIPMLLTLDPPFIGYSLSSLMLLGLSV